MTPDEIITDVLRRWAVEFVQRRIAAARAANLFASKELISSMRYELAGQLQQIQQFYFAMQDYGRILDMRRQKRDKLPVVSEIEEWVKSIGVGRFSSRRGRKGSGTRLANEIAWGVAVKQVQRQRFKKRRQWYNKGVWSDISSLYGRLLAALRDATLDDLKNSLK